MPRQESWAVCSVEVGSGCPSTIAADQKPVELRKFNRYRQIVAVTLDWEGKKGKPMFGEGLTQNICAGGMYVHINPCPPEKTVVQYDVFLPAVYRKGPSVRIAGTGRIVRVERLGGAGRWHGVAVRFSRHLIRVTNLNA